MIRSLYNLEDRLFYASFSCAPEWSRVLKSCSERVGRFADALQLGLRVKNLK